MGVELLMRGTVTANACNRERVSGKSLHWQDDIYFQRLSDGSVRITSFWQYNNCPQERQWTIPDAAWASIISSVSAAGETAESWQQALKFHGSDKRESISRIPKVNWGSIYVVDGDGVGCLDCRGNKPHWHRYRNTVDIA